MSKTLTCLIRSISITFFLLISIPASAGLLEQGKAAYANGQYPTARGIYQQLARSGIPEAQFLLGQMYQNGEGVQQSDTEAKIWYQKAASKGYGPARKKLDEFASTTEEAQPDPRASSASQSSDAVTSTLNPTYDNSIKSWVSGVLQEEISKDQVPHQNGQSVAQNAFNEFTGSWNELYRTYGASNGMEGICVKRWHELIDLLSLRIIQTSYFQYIAGESQSSIERRWTAFDYDLLAIDNSMAYQCENARSSIKGFPDLVSQAHQYVQYVKEIALDEEFVEVVRNDKLEKERLKELERQRLAKIKQEEQRLAEIEREKQLAIQQEKQRLAEIERDKQIAAQRELDRIAKNERDKELAAQRELERIEQVRLNEIKRLEQIEREKQLAAQRERDRIEKIEQEERNRLAKIERDKQLAAQKEQERLARIEEEQREIERQQAAKRKTLIINTVIPTLVFLSAWIGFAMYGRKKNWSGTISYGGGFFVALGIYFIWTSLFTGENESEPFHPDNLWGLKSELRGFDPDYGENGGYPPRNQQSCQLMATAVAVNNDNSKELVFPLVITNPGLYDESQIDKFRNADLGDRSWATVVGYVTDKLDLNDDHVTDFFVMEYSGFTFSVMSSLAYYRAMGVDIGAPDMEPEIGEFACGLAMARYTETKEPKVFHDLEGRKVEIPGTGLLAELSPLPIIAPLNAGTSSHIGTQKPSVEESVKSCKDAAEVVDAKDATQKFYPQFLPMVADNQYYALRFARVDYRGPKGIALVMGGQIRAMFKYTPTTIKNIEGNSSGQYCGVGKWVDISESAGVRIPILEATYIGND